MISRALTGRAVDELAIRLAGATEFAIDEIVRRRGDAVKTAVEAVRLPHPGATPNDVARMSAYRYSRLFAIAGVVSALQDVILVAGTTTELGASLADVVALVYAEVDLVMAV